MVVKIINPLEFCHMRFWEGFLTCKMYGLLAISWQIMPRPREARWIYEITCMAWWWSSFPPFEAPPHAETADLVGALRWKPRDFVWWYQWDVVQGR